MAGRDAEQQAAFERALRSVRAGEPLSQAELDALSVVEGADLAAFAAAWQSLPAGARADLIATLRGAAEQRLRLDFSSLNHLALGDPDASVRRAAVEAALEDRSARLLERLLQLLREDPSAAVRQAAAEDLARFALLAELDDLDASLAGRLRERLREALGDPAEQPRVRAAALAALGYLSDDATLRELERALTDPELRLGAVRGMGRNADPRWTDRLIPALGSEDPRLRLEAARALGEIEDERAVDPLLDLLEDPDREVKLAAIQALGAIGGEDAREALLYLLQDPDAAAREAAERAISDLEFFEDPLGL